VPPVPKTFTSACVAGRKHNDILLWRRLVADERLPKLHASPLGFQMNMNAILEMRNAETELYDVRSVRKYHRLRNIAWQDTCGHDDRNGDGDPEYRPIGGSAECERAIRDLTDALSPGVGIGNIA